MSKFFVLSFYVLYLFFFSFLLSFTYIEDKHFRNSQLLETRQDLQEKLPDFADHIRSNGIEVSDN